METAFNNLLLLVTNNYVLELTMLLSLIDPDSTKPLLLLHTCKEFDMCHVIAAG